MASVGAAAPGAERLEAVAQAAPAMEMRRETAGATALAQSSMMPPKPSPVVQPAIAEAPRVHKQEPVLPPMRETMARPAPQPQEEKHFIAPPPVETPAPQAAPAVTTPTLSAQAPAPPQPQRRMPNLFSRVTGGAAWAKPAALDARESQVTPQMRASSPPRPTAQAPAASMPSLSAAAAPTPAAMAPPASASPQVQQSLSQPPQGTTQPRLSGLDPKDRIAASRAEEDLLDIPAFLRRQAN
jgi:cell division protein FtsZ